MKSLIKVIIVLLTFLVLLKFFLPENPRCSLENIILNDDLMFLGWQRFGWVSPPALPGLGSQDALGVIYEKENAISHHSVYQYKNQLLASLSLRINNQVFFPSSSSSWIWSDLEGSDDWVLCGDEVKIQCGNSDDPLLGDRCAAVIRYGLFISDFSSPIEESVMNQEQFRKIITSIDNNFASCPQNR